MTAVGTVVGMMIGAAVVGTGVGAGVTGTCVGTAGVIIPVEMSAFAHR